MYVRLFIYFIFIYFLLKTTPPMENRGPPDGSGGEAAAVQLTRGLGVSTAETCLVGLGRKE